MTKKQIYKILREDAERAKKFGNHDAKTILELLDALEAEQARNARLSEQIDALIKRGNEVARYVQHTPSCPLAIINYPPKWRLKCSCKLNEVLRGDA